MNLYKSTRSEASRMDWIDHLSTKIFRLLAGDRVIIYYFKDSDINEFGIDKITNRSKYTHHYTFNEIEFSPEKNMDVFEIYEMFDAILIGAIKGHKFIKDGVVILMKK